jgi:hypothetical protein
MLGRRGEEKEGKEKRERGRKQMDFESFER